MQPLVLHGRRVHGGERRARGQVLEAHEAGVGPFLVRVRRREVALDLLIDGVDLPAELFDLGVVQVNGQ